MRILIAAFFLIGLSTALWAQRTVGGTVVDGEGNPAPGISVKIVGVNDGAVTDIDGKFRINVPDDYSILIFSGPGFKKQEIHAGVQSRLEIVLEKTGGVGEEEMALGIGSQSKTTNTGNISQVSGDDIRDNPVSNLESSMQGRTPGVIVKSTGVQVRGSASLTANNSPLYVVDGVPLASGNQSSINPANIKSMEILKDASAAAIYGSRAANGVIVITTHSGSSGKMQVEADYQLGVATPTKFLDLYSPDEYNLQVIEYRIRQFGLGSFVTREQLSIWKETIESGGNLQIGNISFNTLGSFLDSLKYDTDWQKKVFRTGLNHRATASVQGGTEKLGYFASTVYNTQEGILIGQDQKTFNGLVSLNSQVTSKLSANLSLNYIYNTQNRLREDQDLGAPLQSIALPPSDKPDPSNNYYLKVSKLLYNPKTELENSVNRGISNGLISSLGLKYEFLPNLSLDVKTGVDFNKSDDILKLGGETRDGGGTFRGTGSGRTEYGKSKITNYLVNSWVTYSPEIGTDHDLSIVFGGSYEKSKGIFRQRAANISSLSTLKSLDSSDPILQQTIIPGSASVFVSNFTRISYSYLDRYLLQVSGRRDGSSKFSEANRFGTFMAFSGGWILSEESFFSSDFLRFLKLKGSYGQIGNTPPGDFEYQKNYTQVTYGSNTGYKLLNPANEDLKWETTSQINFGMEFSLGSRISGSVDYYIKKTKDLLFPEPVSPTSGFISVIRNGGKMKNTGTEIGLSTLNVDLPDIKWSTDFNISFTENKVYNLNNERLVLGTNAFLEGQPASVFYLRKYAGVDDATGDALYDDGNGGTTSDWESAPRMAVGNPNPGYFGGLTNTISYKNFELSFMFQFVGDVDIYFATGEFMSNSGILGLTQLASQTDRWYSPGNNAKYPRLNPNQTDTQPSTRWLEDGSYARLTNLIFTYKIPQTLLDKFKLRNAEVYIGGQNLWTITKYSGYDPDVVYIDPTTGTLGQNINRGVDNFTPPQPRIFTTGIKIGL